MCVASIVAACAGAAVAPDKLPDSPGHWEWRLPAGLVPPPVPADNPMSSGKVQLGRRLFYDTRLSVNGLSSCASCHEQHLAFTDGRANAIGATGERHPRSSMTLVNIAYNDSYTWASRDLRTLEQQIAIPLFNEQPIELGLRGREDAFIETLRGDPDYARLFPEAFPETTEPFVIDNVIRALAAFVRSIVSADSAFDRLLFQNDQGALSASALSGMRLFFSDELKCGGCHGGPSFAGGPAIEPTPQTESEFHNTGLYNVAGNDRYPSTDSGLRLESGEVEDDGKFRAPTLRNIALTAPYMHDGSIATLTEVIDHYASGGRTIKDGDYAGDGSKNSRKSPHVTGFQLSAAEKQDLLNFLESLTDYSVINDSRFAEPDDMR